MTSDAACGSSKFLPSTPQKKSAVIQTLAEALENRGYHELTPVQKAVTDPGLNESDLLVSAQTGSGKTVGFGLAIAPTVLSAEGRFDAAGAPLALIIAPTRELALQVRRELAWLYEGAGAVVVSCVGGMDMREERRALGRGAHIVVATPGRLRDHLQRGSLDMSAIRAVVLDEADEMLDLGFREDLEFILGLAPQERRTLMFSATVPRGIAVLAKTYQNEAVRITTTAERSQHSDIAYRALSVAPQDGENAVVNLLRYYEARNAIVFCNRRDTVNRMTTRLSNRGFSVVALSGELTQSERSHALQAMRDGRARVCVATDVAARGIDLPHLELVIHAELPTNSETLLHRSGRTGRAGRKGVSALIVPNSARKKAERLLQGAKLRAEWGGAPSAEDVIARDEERLLEDPVWSEPATEQEIPLAQRLMSEFQPEQLALAAARFFAAGRSAPEELSPTGSEQTPRPPAAFGPGVWFSLPLGRSEGAEPRWLLPMLCRAGGIEKGAIGAIRVQSRETFVEIAEAEVENFTRALGPALEVEANGMAVPLTRLAEQPQLDRHAPRKPGFAPKGAMGKRRGPPGAARQGKPAKFAAGPDKPGRGKRHPGPPKRGRKG